MAKKPSKKPSEMSSSELWQVMIMRFVVTGVMMIGIPLLAAGRFNWREAWAYGLMTTFVMVAGRSLLLIREPETIIERMEAGTKDDAKPWDKVLVPLVAVYVPMIAWLVAGLDERFGWSADMSITIKLAALAVYLAGSLFSTWATFANRFFSSHVRIQTERGHKVADTGPYSFVRHPGYAGGNLSWIATPFIFGSWWALVPCVVTIALYTYRTSLEDRTLQEELPGYKEYAQRVRYRLLPGVW